MPKIIENLETKLMEEARRQIETAGYSAMTIRSVAAACGVGVGTVYNYFRSKDALVASYMLRGWQQCLDAIHAAAEVAEEVRKGMPRPTNMTATSEIAFPVIRCIYEQLCRYAADNQALFRDPAAASTFAGALSHYHGMLCSQLAEPLRPLCDSDFMAEFIAESLLTWTMQGKGFDEMYGMIGRLFCE